MRHLDQISLIKKWTHIPAKEATSTDPASPDTYKLYYPSGKLAAFVTGDGIADIWPLDGEQRFHMRLEGGLPLVLCRAAEMILCGSMAVA